MSGPVLPDIVLRHEHDDEQGVVPIQPFEELSKVLTPQCHFVLFIEEVLDVRAVEGLGDLSDVVALFASEGQGHLIGEAGGVSGCAYVH